MRIKEIIKLIFLLLGIVIGAGFVSGKEIFMFFGAFNIKSLLSILLCGVMLFLGFLLFLFLPQNKKYYIFKNSKFNKNYNVIMMFCLIVSASSMTAAINALFGFIAGGITLAFCIIVVMSGINGMKKINVVLMPVLLFVVMFICLSSFNSFNKIILLKHLLLNSLLYFGMNIFYASEVLVSAGKQLSKKEKILGSFVACIIIVLFLIIITLSFSFNEISLNELMPIYALVLLKGKIFIIIYLIVLWIGIFTSLICVLHSLKVKAGNLFNFNEKSLIIFCIFAFLLSFLGFGNIVKILYPIEGIIGIVYCGVIFCTCVLNSNKKTAII